MADLADFESRAEAAMIAAAVGDALGWPQENRSRRLAGGREAHPELEFTDWRRRAGGRYANHEEVIGAGEYSDDTQLIAAVARSLLTGGAWWSHWTRVELPFWLLYERGGGGATKRASQSWAKGVAPWTGASADSYVTAGGNGVAMRVLPHCICGNDFSEVAASIVADGIATHGHPRAHVGALAYGYALWRALRRRDRLPYGALINDVLDAVDAWSRRPRVGSVAPDWEDATQDAADGSYDELWKKTVEEMMALLGTCAEGISHGALSVDREILDALGAFDQRVNSAGTVTAAGALFLASRYASRAPQGLVAAAFAFGGDTDTLASMTGSLLAAINGSDWLGRARERVQDDRYLIRLGRALIASTRQDLRMPSKRAFEELGPRLARTHVGEELRLPDGRVGHVRNIVSHPTKTRNDITTFVVETVDGQTLFFKRVERVRKGAEIRVDEDLQHPRRIVAALRVKDLERSMAFWRDIGGFEVSNADGYVNVGGQIELIPADSLETMPLALATDRELRRPKGWIVIFVDSDFGEVRKRVKRAKIPSVATTGPSGQWEGIRCLDPDDNVVEFRASNPSR